MKKFLSLLLVSVLATSCTLGGASEDATTKSTETTGPNGQTEVSVSAGDFDSLYGAYLTAQYNEAKMLLDISNTPLWKEILAPKKSNGDITFKANAGQFGNLDAFMKIAAHASGLDSKVDFSDIKFDLTAQGQEVNFTADEISLIQSPFQNFVKFKGLVAPEMLNDQIKAFQEFEGKWIEIPSVQDENAITLMKEIITLSEDEIKDFITKYPVLKAKGEATVDGTKNTFDVELDGDNAVALTKALIKRLNIQNADFDEDAQSMMKENIQKANTMITTTITFDTENHLFAKVQSEITANDETGTVVVNTDKNSFFVEVDPEEVDSEDEDKKLTINAKKDGDKWVASFDFVDASEHSKGTLEIEASDEKLSLLSLDINIDDETIIQGKLTCKDDVIDGNLTVQESDTTVLEATLAGTTKDDTITSLTAEIKADDSNIVKAEYKHENNTSEGKVTLTIDGETVAHLDIWTTYDNILTSFDLVATIEGIAKLEIHTKDLKEDITHGTISVESVNPLASGKATANIGLGAGKEIFALTLDTPVIDSESVPDEINEMIKDFSMSLIAHGKEEKTDEKVQMPTDFVPYTEIEKTFAPSSPAYDDADVFDGSNTSFQSEDGSVMFDGSDISVQSADGKDIEVGENGITISQ